MTALLDEVRAQTETLRHLRDAKSPTADAEAALLRGLATAMVREESSFDPAHGTARILGATADRGEVRLTIDGAWKVGASPERDLLAGWGDENALTLDEVLEGVQKNFSSARVGNLVAEVREALGAGAHP